MQVSNPYDTTQTMHVANDHRIQVGHSRLLWLTYKHRLDLTNLQFVTGYILNTDGMYVLAEVLETYPGHLLRRAIAMQMNVTF